MVTLSPDTDFQILHNNPSNVQKYFRISYDSYNSERLLTETILTDVFF